jgi:GNAT superfamily N-acetyltransferase
VGGVLEIRFAGIADLAALEDLRLLAWRALDDDPPPPSLARPPLAEELALHACVRVVGLDGRPAGFIVVVPADYDNAEIDRIVVAPDLRSRGIGRLLMDDAELTWVAQGIDRFEAHATPRGAAFYRRMGFVTDAVTRTLDGESVRMHKDLPGARPLTATL